MAKLQAPASTWYQGMRERIAALTQGVKPTKDMVRGSIAPLLKKLQRQAANRRAVEEEAVRHFRAMEGLRRDAARPDRRELAASRAYRDAVERRVRGIRVAPPKVEPFAPQLRSGSIWAGFTSPYTDLWTDGMDAKSNNLTGTWSTFSKDTNHSAAGVCQFFTPVPGRFNIRFAPYMPVSWGYDIVAFELVFPPSPTVSRAWSSGFVGAYVSAWNGRQWVEMADVRTEIWNQRVSIRDDQSDSGDSAWWTPQANFQAVGDPVTFALWAWGGVSTSARDGTFGWAVADASMSATVPFMIVEQMI